MEKTEKTAIIMMNLGAPDSLEAVRPFLFNLFNDPAIIGIIQPFRFLLAGLISILRTRKARGIYERIGGKSPLLENTEAQATALEKFLGPGYRVFIAMRYWHPRSADVVDAVRAWGADRVILLPLYPQFSTTTTQSSIEEWERVCAARGLNLPTRHIFCYPSNDGFVEAIGDLIGKSLASRPDGPFRILFTAHGLPEKIVNGGDPYVYQVEETVRKVMSLPGISSLDHEVCYQSRVGPLAWVGPSLDEAMGKAASDGLGVILVPVAFVSEHSETLVELDIEYREVAEKLGIGWYIRVPASGDHPAFIRGLADLVLGDSSSSLTCPSSFSKCICRQRGLKNV